MTNEIWFQIPKCYKLLLFFLVLYHCKLNILRFKTVGRKKREIQSVLLILDYILLLILLYFDFSKILNARILVAMECFYIAVLLLT